MHSRSYENIPFTSPREAQGFWAKKVDHDTGDREYSLEVSRMELKTTAVERIDETGPLSLARHDN